MKALQITSYTGPEGLVYQEAPVPRPARGQVTIDVEYAGANYVEALFAEGLASRPLPWTPGIEAAGRVRELGEGVEGLTVGEPVAAPITILGAGGYGQVALTKAPLTVPLPPGMDPALASVVPSNTTTALAALERTVRIQPGEHVLVQAAAGARVQRLGHLADDGAHLGRVQALADQGGQGASVGGLGDDEGGVVLLDVEDPLDALVLHQDGAAGRLQDLGPVGSRVGEHENRHRAVENGVSPDVTDYAWECCGQGGGQCVAPGADRGRIRHEVASSRAEEHKCVWSECTGRQCPDRGCLGGQVRNRGRRSRNRGWRGGCRAWRVHGPQHGTVGRWVRRRKLGTRAIGGSRRQDVGQVQHRLAHAPRQEPPDLGDETR